MGDILEPGQAKHGYTIVQELSRGAYTVAYEARSGVGEKVFFKHYKSPTPLVEWFRGFVEHQTEIKRRIESDRAAKERCYRFIEFFTDPHLYQVFEFVEGGMSLTECLARRDEFSWGQLVAFAKVMMFGVKDLHRVGVIHSDLKPDNIYLIPDEGIALGYKLRIIDLDWAVLEGKRAPWHGIEGYVGTPGYQSPEHLRGEVPVAASDVFTCGIMLGEILGAGHPFASAGDDYGRAAQSGAFEPVRLRHGIDKVADQSFVEGVINACLHPQPGNRPTAAQVADALVGKVFPWHADVPGTGISTPPTRTKVPDKATSARAVEILFDGRHLTTVSVDSTLGKPHFKSVHSEVQYLSAAQFRLFREAGRWMIEHVSGATNETIVDGGSLKGAEPIRDGMRVSVGNTNKGVEKFPLELRLRP